ncbi:MAG: ORF6N domain-containing protein [Bacteroidaceae bacterium]|nr:ORF6N domain-containing protein [Bacteroidaceae bacterium]MDE6000600.1 ORF6N domain-containing protein [Bacteroidaceae bacterium]
MLPLRTKRLNEQVKRNITRFSSDAMFTLTKKAYNSLRSHIATSNKRGSTYYIKRIQTIKFIPI